MPSNPDLIVLHEHPEWQKPLFAALRRRGVSFEPFDVTRAAFSNVEPLRAPLYFNQASPSAYVRGNTRAVPLALAYMRSLELLGARVLNGANVFALELSKSAQATLLRTLGIDCPRSITFNDARALRAYAPEIRWPALLKPDQGGSGARIQVVDSLDAGGSDLFTRSGHVAARQPVPAPGVSPARSRAWHHPPRVSRRRAALRDASRHARAVQSVPLAGVQSGRRQRRRVRAADRGADICAACRVLSVSGGSERRRRHGTANRARCEDSTSAASNTSTPSMGGASSTTSTPIRTSARRLPLRSASIRSNVWSTSSRVSWQSGKSK